MRHSLEKALAFHCAPALAAIKPANLISCDRSQYPRLDADITALNHQLNANGIYFRPVCRCESRTLLLVYRRKVLERHLQDASVQAFLLNSGYPAYDIDAILAHLQQRLTASDEFPHETGIILGYPLEDVEGFLTHGGKNCLFCGYWKVYADEMQKQVLFRRFTQCRRTICRLIDNGMSIAQLFQAA